MDDRVVLGLPDVKKVMAHLLKDMTDVPASVSTAIWFARLLIVSDFTGRGGRPHHDVHWGQTGHSGCQ